MTELPPERSMAHDLMSGLVSRQFRKDGGGATCGDRSEWTDTPTDKARKEKVCFIYDMIMNLVDVLLGLQTCKTCPHNQCYKISLSAGNLIDLLFVCNKAWLWCESEGLVLCIRAMLMTGTCN